MAEEQADGIDGAAAIGTAESCETFLAIGEREIAQNGGIAFAFFTHVSLDLLLPDGKAHRAR